MPQAYWSQERRGSLARACDSVEQRNMKTPEAILIQPQCLLFSNAEAKEQKRPVQMCVHCIDVRFEVYTKEPRKKYL